MTSITQAAVDVRKNAYVPYSKYNVGAAVETDDGSIISGCNMESSSYGLSACAERVALATAVAQGYRSFRAMAIASVDGAAPCGACRQVIWELCGDVPITLVNDAGNEVKVNSGSLLPQPFDDKNLQRASED